MDTLYLIEQAIILLNESGVMVIVFAGAVASLLGLLILAIKRAASEGGIDKTDWDDDDWSDYGDWQENFKGDMSWGEYKANHYGHY